MSAHNFFIVGIGASAGGLDAFKKFIKAIPDDSGMAYVLIQHLDPTHNSLLPELLQKVTGIPVLEISDDIKIEPDHIYVHPSNKMLTSYDGVLRLTPRPEQNKSIRNLPIDLFFTTLAEVHKTQAIGIVLSGTGADGTEGLKAIKNYGGFTFAQDEESAAYASMPHNAINADIIDYILPPEKMPAKILEIAQNLNERSEMPHQDEEVIKNIISLLRIRKGVDFTYYKRTTVRRRILRRIAINKNDSPVAYLKYLKENKAEQDNLFQDLLIPVTTFFRDEKTFDKLYATVFPIIQSNKSTGEPIRIWVPGCSTGEEAYSIAICFKELLGDSLPKVQIFATDISVPAITKGRLGIYSKEELKTVTPQRLQEHFTKSGANYNVNKNVREMCVFAAHNFLKDPPFGKMDLISCRNVLIYMEPYLQKKALATFHYALNQKGYLLLGKAESTNSVSHLFTSTGKTEKIFLRKDAPAGFHISGSRREQNFVPGDRIKNKIACSDYQKAAEDIMLRKYIPGGVVVNDAFDIVHFSGNTSAYLEQLPGKPSHNLLKLAKHGLAFDLRTLLHKAKKEKTSVIKDNIPVELNIGLCNVSIEAMPLASTIDSYFLVLFHDKFKIPVSQPAGKTNRRKNNELELRIRQLEQELAQTHEDMRSITEDQESANEELQSDNEELLSSSEELQSLNEEMETSKEELQSTNEELTVVNQQIISLNEQLIAARNYAESIVATVQEPLLVLDKNLRIISTNKAFYKMFKVAERETEGVLIFDLGDKQWNIPSLRILLEEILPQKTEVSDFEVSHVFPKIGLRIMQLNATEMLTEIVEEKLILLSIHDITNRATLLLKEKEFKKQLKKQVEEQTIELIQTNLELVQLNKELQAFTYISSHDLQEPLRKVQTYINRLTESNNSGLTVKEKDYIMHIRASMIRMRKLIDDLLAYSLASQKEKKLEVTDLNQILDEVKKDLADLLNEKNISIQNGVLCEANINRFQFRQLLNNLLGNAIKFSSEYRKPLITINSEIQKGSALSNINLQLSPDKNYCHISVTDNGIGFSPLYQNKIFEIFQRLHDTKKYPGTGIGLAIVKKIVDNHHGFITATGAVNKGTTFDIYLPDKDPDNV